MKQYCTLFAFLSALYYIAVLFHVHPEGNLEGRTFTFPSESVPELISTAHQPVMRVHLDTEMRNPISKKGLNGRFQV